MNPRVPIKHGQLWRTALPRRTWCARILEAWALLALLILLAPSRAHDGPEHEIEELTVRLREGESADLYLQRAVEYRILNKLTEATRDLERALQLSPASPSVHHELSLAYHAAGKTNDALSTITAGLSLLTLGTDRAPLLIARAEFYRARSENGRALADTHLALTDRPPQVEWYLLRSRIQARLKDHDGRLHGIEEGLEVTGAALLEHERVEALLDAGRFTEALRWINPELEQARVQSSWRLRRARALLGLQRPREAEADLQSALTEIEHRLAGNAAEPSLLADRGRAHDLLGHEIEAHRDYDDAQQKGFHEDWLQERIRILKEKIDAKAKTAP